MEEQENTNRESQKKNDNTNKSAIIFAKELVINFRLLLIALGITLLFAVIFYIACYPTLTGGYGASKYDENAIGNVQLDNLPSIRLGSFEDDIKSKTLYCFIISIAALIGGRYIYKGVVWVNVTYENSKPILINSKNIHPNIVNSNDNISNKSSVDYNNIIAGVLILFMVVLFLFIRYISYQ